MEVRVSQLSKAYGGVPVLERVSFTAGPGITCVMGPSGQGKTTLLRILLGLERPDSGAVEGTAGLRLSAVFQEDRLLPDRTALENLRFVLGPAMDSAGARALLEELGLPGADDRPVRAYSGGMRRRVALARALAAPYDLLAIDEPFTGLDGETRRRCLDCLRERSRGRIVVLVTHEEADVAALGGRVVTLA
jgi:NitT/TauT family transport system ATP-binding protein